MNVNEQVHSLNPEIIRLAEQKGRHCAGRMGFRRDEARDIAHELVADYLRRLPRFDSTRASPLGFARLVMNRRLATLAEFHCSTPRDYRRTVLFDPVEHGHAHRDSTLPSGRNHVEEQAIARLDFAALLAELPAPLRDVYSRLAAGENAREISRAMGISRATVYRRIAQLGEAIRQTDRDLPRIAVP
jgi:DNA-directed RNA polymerase specialized sigma24 family protein